MFFFFFLMLLPQPRPTPTDTPFPYPTLFRALLRIPDEETTDKLIRDKLGEADWKRHLGQSDSVLVNASTWGLMLTGHLVDLADDTRRDVHNAFKRLVGRVGEPVIRLAVRQAMKIMGQIGRAHV